LEEILCDEDNTNVPADREPELAVVDPGQVAALAFKEE